MAARELGRAGKKVTILEARERCGGRIHPLPSAEFGYPAEGGAEFVHGEAPITHRLLREAGLSTMPIQGARWTVENGAFSRRDPSDPHTDRLHQVLTELRSDMTVAEFLQQHFAGPEYDRLRRSVVRRVEGYDAADPRRASVLALREEWMDGGRSTRIAGGYGALVDFLASECRKNGVAIRLGSAVTAIEASDGGSVVHCANGDANECDAAILTVPIPLLREIVLPPPEREKASVAANIGFGNIIKILLRFETRWWLENRKDLADLTFLLSDARIPVWWTQHPAEFSVLTGWFGGPKTEAMAHFAEHELIEAGIASLADIFDLIEITEGIWSRRRRSTGKTILSRAEPIPTPRSKRAGHSLYSQGRTAAVLFSGEALYRGRDIQLAGAPSLIALTAFGTSLYAVTIIAGTLIPLSLIFASNSNPSIPGIRMSRIASPNVCSASNWTASSPELTAKNSVAFGFQGSPKVETDIRLVIHNKNSLVHAFTPLLVAGKSMTPTKRTGINSDSQEDMLPS